MEYRFLTTWLLEAERERVWEAVFDSEAWPSWWRGVKRAVAYEWNVRTTKRWMNLFAPIGRPLFAWNHDWVMRNGGEGMAGLLASRLLASD